MDQTGMELLRAWWKAEKGRVSRTAEACGVTHGAVLQWGEVPPRHVLTIEALTGISRHLLRPDLYGEAAA